MLESALPGPVGFLRLAGGFGVPRHMPLAGHGGAIPRGAQDFGNGHAAVAEVPPVARLLPVGDHVADAGLVRIQPGQQRSAGGAAAARIIELCEPQPARRQLIQVGSGNFPAITTDIREPHIIHQNDRDIRARRGGGGGGTAHSGRQQQENKPDEERKRCVHASIVRGTRRVGNTANC